MYSKPASTASGRAMRSACDRELRSSRASGSRSEEHTSELQSPCNLVCRLLLEKKKTECDKVGCIYTVLVGGGLVLLWLTSSKLPFSRCFVYRCLTYSANSELVARLTVSTRALE